MQNSYVKKQSKNALLAENHQLLLEKSNLLEEIGACDISELDNEIALLESQLLAEQSYQNELELQKSSFAPAQLESRMNVEKEKLSQEKQEKQNRLVELQHESLMVQESLKLKEKQEQRLQEDKKELEEQIACVSANIQTLHPDLDNFFQTNMMMSFLDIDIDELSFIYQFCVQTELFYACSIRLGLVYFQRGNVLQMLNLLCYLPEDILKQYYIYDTFNLILKKFIIAIPGILSAKNFLEKSKEQNAELKELFLWLSILVQVTSDYRPYLELLNIYLEKEEWHKVMIVSDYLKSFAPNKEINQSLENIKKHTEECRQSYRQSSSVDHLFKYQQVTTIFNFKSSPAKKASSKIFDAHQGILENSTSLFHRSLSFLNQSSFDFEIKKANFLFLWKEYQIGLNFLYNKNIPKAIEKFKEILKSNVFFIEAKIKLEEYSPHFNWAQDYSKGM